MTYTTRLLILLAGLSILGCEAGKKTPPNILILLADDMGYADLGCYGGLSNTPHLDKLAADGIRFTDFYAGAPNCSPSRTALMTGRNPARVGMYNYRPEDHPMHLRSEEVTIAEVLKGQGYQTAHVGKWHLGCLPQDPVLNHPQPDAQGFDYSLGTENNAIPSHLNPINFVRNGVPLDTVKGYSCQILADEAIHWLDDLHQKENPFFLYVAFHEPHAKVASPPELVQKYPGFSPRDAEYLANVENLDLAVGRILDYLKANDLWENTFIVFASDNGSYRQASNGDLRAVKSYVYEGGIRVPGIIHWPALAQQSRTISEPAGFVDVMPTICELTNVQPPADRELDGTSILPLLNGEAWSRERPLYWYFYRTSPEIAVRVDDVMILGKDANDTIPRTHRFAAPDMAYIRSMHLTDYELFDLSKDIGERNNLIETHPKREELTKLVTDQMKEIQEKGYYWEQLPEANGTRKVKTDWVKYQLK